MPIYEYRCQFCGHELEQLQRMSDPALRDCPECGKAGLRRLISAAGFRLKGAGWYETDFKQGSKRNLAESSNGKGEGAAATDGGGKADAGAGDAAKPAAKDGAADKAAAGAGAGKSATSSSAGDST